MQQLTLRSRILALIALVVACFLVVFGWSIYGHVGNLYAEKRTATRHAVEAAHAVATRYAELARAGTLPDAEARARALTALASMRYGEGDYFWVNDMEPRMVMHPLRPELDGKDLSANADPSGKRLFVEMAAVCRRDGAGYVDYLWPKPGHDAPQPKISYVKLVPEWGWVVGSGIYVDDVQDQVRADLGRVGLGLLLTLVFVGGLTWRALSGIVAPMRRAVGAVRSGATQINAAAQEVASTSQSLSQGASSQAASIEEISASMEEVGSLTRANAERAARVAALMGGLDQQSRSSQALLDEMRQAMDAMEESSRQVSRIAKTVDEIAFQTNILALNAAVEAARAGEAGLGFAVVADEVRALAQRAAQAARETSALIERSLEDARAGAGKVDAVAGAIAGFTAAVGEARGLAAEVDQASRQQQQGLEQVAASVAQMERVTQSTAAAAEESAAASEELHAQSEVSLGAVVEIAAMVGDLSEPAAPSPGRRGPVDAGHWTADARRRAA